MLRSLSLILAAAIGFAEGMARSQPLTEIVVAGTVHKATTKYAVEDLVHIFNKARPGVILFEYPADMMTPNYVVKENWEY